MSKQRKTSIRKGDLVLVGSDNHRRIVMVTDPMPKVWSGVLIHTCPELATDADIAIPHGVVMPYPVVLQFDLYGTFDRSQVIRIMGRVPVEGLRVRCHDPYAIDYIADRLAPLGSWKGIPLAPGGRWTERWRFKEEQLTEDLMPLTRPFRRAFRW